MRNRSASHNARFLSVVHRDKPAYCSECKSPKRKERAKECSRLNVRPLRPGGCVESGIARWPSPQMRLQPGFPDELLILIPRPTAARESRGCKIVELLAVKLDAQPWCLGHWKAAI